METIPLDAALAVLIAEGLLAPLDPAEAGGGGQHFRVEPILRDGTGVRRDGGDVCSGQKQTGAASPLMSASCHLGHRKLCDKKICVPTFEAAGVSGLQRVLPDQISVRREIWVSVRTEQNHLARIKSVTQFIKHIVNTDTDS